MGLVTNLMKRRFLRALDRIHTGRVHLTTPEGTTHDYGTTGPEVDLEIRDWTVLVALVTRGDVGLGESYIAGHWDSSSIEDLLTLALRNIDAFEGFAAPSALARARMRFANGVTRLNSLRGASRNIRAHYDVGNEFYQLWLDPGMTYSSALFTAAADDDDLEAAQRRKNDRILSKLAGGERILEIGCGWGGFAEAAAGRGRHVTGLTLSPSQKGYADARLDGRADIRLQDYREVRGRFDNIVSIEMIEAVGERYWPVYFATLKARLAEGGRAVLQAITVQDVDFEEYRRNSDFVRHHIFPGGMLPCNAILAHEAAKAGLTLRNSFSFGQDYARTCRIWSDRMMAERDRIRALGYGERFLRCWQYYLEGCAAAFVTRRTDVVQVELTHATG